MYETYPKLKANPFLAFLKEQANVKGISFNALCERSATRLRLSRRWKKTPGSSLQTKRWSCWQISWVNPWKNFRKSSRSCGATLKPVLRIEVWWRLSTCTKLCLPVGNTI